MFCCFHTSNKTLLTFFQRGGRFYLETRALNHDSRSEEIHSDQHRSEHQSHRLKPKVVCISRNGFRPEMPLRKTHGWECEYRNYIFLKKSYSTKLFGMKHQKSNRKRDRTTRGKDSKQWYDVVRRHKDQQRIVPKLVRNGNYVHHGIDVPDK